jgi:hypothetical protein
MEFKPPRNLISALRNNAPSTTLSENYGRRGEYYGGEDAETKGYKSIMLFIQIGLSDYNDLILEVVKLILSVQNDFQKKYSIVPAIFGKGLDLIHATKYFDMGYIEDRQAGSTLANILKTLTGTDKSDIPAIIPLLFPKTDMRSLYYGKTKFDRDDLMIIIGKKGEVVFAENLKDKLTNSVKKRILFVEIEENSVNWIFRNYEPEFLSLQ